MSAISLAAERYAFLYIPLPVQTNKLTAPNPTPPTTKDHKATGAFITFPAELGAEDAAAGALAAELAIELNVVCGIVIG